MNAARFNRHIEAGRAKAETNLPALERGYRITLQAAARHAGDRFAALATDHLIADASNPKWTPPQNDQLFDPAALATDAQKRTKPARQASVKAVMAPALADIGIAYDLTNPLVANLLGTLGVRAADMGDAVRGDIARTVLASYQQGLSVVDTAKAIQDAVEGIAPVRAAMLARTDLIGLANGASLAAAQIVAGAADDGGAGLGYKSWLATEDERTRDSHAEADGQVIPVDQPFIVGGEQAMYPGDPDLSDGEAINCRCTIVYLDASEVGGDVTAGGAPTGAVGSPGHMDASPDSTLTADVTITVGDDAAETVADETPMMPTRWRAILCIEGKETQDNATLSRMLREGTTTWREVPLPLGVIFETPHSDEVTAEVCGSIDTIYRDEYDYRVIWGEGPFNADDVGMRAGARVADLSLRGISIDPYVPEVEITELAAETETSPAKMLVTMIDSVILGATICPAGAIEGAQISIVSSAEEGVMPLQSDTCFVLTVKQPAPMAELVADGWAAPLAALTASVERLAAASAPLSIESVKENLRALDDRLASFAARTREDLDLVAAVGQANAARLDRIGDPSEPLRRLERDVTALLSARAPRDVAVVRDADGKFAGLREG